MFGHIITFIYLEKFIFFLTQKYLPTFSLLNTATIVQVVKIRWTLHLLLIKLIFVYFNLWPLSWYQALTVKGCACVCGRKRMKIIQTCFWDNDAATPETPFSFMGLLLPHWRTGKFLISQSSIILIDISTVKLNQFCQPGITLKPW